MPLIKSISGIRGTIGGKPGEGLTPLDVVKFSAAYTRFIQQRQGRRSVRIVVGRDARISGKMISELVCSTIISLGADVIDIGLTTTPTAEMAVIDLKCSGGVIITASHNPKQWNALKLLNEEGEFLSDKDGQEILALSEQNDLDFATVHELGKYSTDDTQIRKHIDKILDLPLVDADAIRDADLLVAVDAVNSTGGIAVPLLLKELGVNRVIPLFCEPTGEFPHNPEPLPEHLEEISKVIVRDKADLGIVVDPDVDRLAFVNEMGEPVGEEYTLVAVADYILKHKKGNTVSNLSSTQALGVITEKAGGKYFASAVGEVNVVEMMKEVDAVIGGEGNGGVIYPPLHYGRDALAGIALFLTHLVKSGKKCSALRDQYPNFFISKNKIEMDPRSDVEVVMKKIAKRYKNKKIDTIDGIRIHFDNQWVHLRRSNTEPIIRIYAESDMMTKADNLAKKIMADLREIINEH